jgi:hypothetical protein
VYSLRQDLPATADLDQLDAVAFDIVVLANLLQRGRDGSGAGLIVERRQLLGGNGAAAREERRLKQLR